MHPAVHIPLIIVRTKDATKVYAHTKDGYMTIHVSKPRKHQAKEEAKYFFSSQPKIHNQQGKERFL